MAMRFGLKNYSNPTSQHPRTQSQWYAVAIFSLNIQTLLVKANQSLSSFLYITMVWGNVPQETCDEKLSAFLGPDLVLHHLEESTRET